MRHLAGACDRPAIGMMWGVADITLHHSTRVMRFDLLQAVRAAKLLDRVQLHLGLALEGTSPSRAGWRPPDPHLGLGGDAGADTAVRSRSGFRPGPGLPLDGSNFGKREAWKRDSRQVGLSPAF